MFFARVIGRTISTTIRHLVVFMGLAVVAYAATKAMALLAAPILPVPVPHSAGMMMAGLQRLVGTRLFQSPAAVIELLAMGMMVHRAYIAWGNGKTSLRADVVAAGRAFWALAGIALVWVVLGILPFLPDWFRQPPIVADWYWDAHWLPDWARLLIFNYVQWHPFIGIGLIILLVLGILWCLAVPVAVVEHLGPVAAFRRSMELTKGWRLQVFVLWLIYAALGMGLIIGSGWLQHMPQLQAWPPLQALDALRWIFGTIVMAVGTTAIYLEARRHEALLTSQTSATEPDPTAPQ